MAKLNFVKKARKEFPGTDVKTGDSYYWWEFRFGGMLRQKNKPRRSQLTQSGFLGQVWDIEDEIEALTLEELISSGMDEIIERIRELGQEQEDKLSNMPDQLQETGSGEMLRGRVDMCEEWASNLEQVEIPDLEEVLGEIQGCCYEGE